MDDSAINNLADPSADESCRLVDFDHAEVVPGIIGDTWFLNVAGTKSTATMTIKLSPLTYVRQPEYWEIQVLGCEPGVELPVLTPFSVTIDVTHLRGTAGTAVIGASTSQRIDVGGG